MKKLILGVAMMAAALTAQAANYLYWTLDFGELWSGTELTGNPLLQPGETQDVWLIATKTDGSETVKFTDDSYPIGPTITAAADANIGGMAYTDITSLGDLQYWTFAFALGNYASGDWVVISEKTGYNVFKYSVTTDPTEIVQKVLNGAEDTVWHYLPLTLKSPAVDHGSVKFYTNGVEVVESATPGEYVVESNSAVTVVFVADSDYAFADGATALTNVIDRADEDPYLVETTDIPHWSGTLYLTASGLFKDSGLTEPFDEDTTTWSVAGGVFTMSDFTHPGKLVATEAVQLVGTGTLVLATDDENEKAFTAPDVDTLWVTVQGANPATNALAEATWDETEQTFLVGGKSAQKLVFAERPTSKLTVPDAPEGTKEVKVFIGDEEILPGPDGDYSIPSGEPVRVEYVAEPGKFYDGKETSYVIDDISTEEDPVKFPTELTPSEPTIHKHCVCGHTGCTSTDHDPDQTWVCVATLPASPGYYVLTNDIVITETYHPASGTYLCLAGHVITNSTPGQAAITNDVGETFTLVDCTRLPGAVSGDVKAEGEIDLNRGTIEGDAENVTNNGGEVEGTTKGGEIRGGEISGPIQGATIYGGTFANAISDATIYGGVFNAPVTSSTVYGGLFTDTISTNATGYSDQEITGSGYKVVGKENTITIVGGRIVLGSLTFNPTNEEYIATGVIPLENVNVNIDTTVVPNQYVLVAGVVIYVDADGDDSTGNGSVEKPYKTLKTACNAIPTQGTIALLSDISLPSGFGAALNISDSKQITLTSAAPTGLLLANAPGDYTGVHSVKRGALTADNLIVAGGQKFVLRQVKIDGENLASRLIKHDAGQIILDTNTILTGAPNKGAISVFADTCRVTMKSNAQIFGNSGLDGGIGLVSGSELRLSGDVVVYDNYKDGNPYNVSILSNQIVIEGELGEKARIGVSASSPSAGMVVATGTVSYTVTDADARRFLDDKGAYKLVKSGNAIVFEAFTEDDNRTLIFNGVTGGTNLVLTLDKPIDMLAPGDFFVTRNGEEVVPENVKLTVTDGTNVVVSIAGVDFDGYTIGVKIVNGGVKVNGGAEVTKFYTTHVHDGIEWKAWGATDSLPTTAGNWFLKQDVTLTAEYVPVDGVKLCLNGKTITQSASARVINVGAGVTFELYDCQDTGVVTGGAAEKGAGIYVASGATFEMLGGAITDNVATVRGGGVYALGTVRVGTAAVVLDNLVAGNADNLCLGPGSALIVLGESADFIKTIGLITDPMPTATNSVAINCTREKDDLTFRCATDMADTVIRQRPDGSFELACLNSKDVSSGYQPDPGDPEGLYHFDAQRNLDGSVTLSGYWKTDDPTKTFTVGSYLGGFRKEYDDMSAFTNQNFVLTIPYEEIGAITEIYTIFGEDDAVTYAIDGVHEHCVCGDNACIATGHVCSNLLWRKWREVDSLPSAPGNYFLAHDVALTTAYVPPTGVNLCFNGHLVKQTVADKSVIEINSGCVFALTDCNPDKEHFFNYFKTEKWTLNPTATSGIEIADITDDTADNTVVKVKGGCLTGGSAKWGAGIFSSGELRIFGGNIIGNEAHDDDGAVQGGGVYTEGVASMCGGRIIGNSAIGTDLLNYESSLGGGICVTGDFTLDGGQIVYNSNVSDAGAGGYGGGVAVYNENGPCRFTLVRGEVSHNRAYGDGGVCVYKGEFIMQGGSVSENAAVYAGGVSSWYDVNRVVMTGGEVADNVATDYYGGFNLYAGSLTAGGTPKIYGNTVDSKSRNLELGAGVTVEISTNVVLAAGAEFGVTTATPVQPYHSVAITSNGTADDLAYFTADIAGEEVVFAGDHLILQVPWIEVCPENLTNATYQVLTNGAPVELTGGKYLVPSNGANVVIVYTPNAPYCFDDGAAVKTNAVDTSTDPSTNPPLPADPSVKLTSASDLTKAIAMLEDLADGCKVKWYVANDFTIDAKSVIAKNGLDLTIIGDGHTITAGTDCSSIFELVATNGSAAVYTFTNAFAFADNRSEAWMTTEPLVKIVTDVGTVTLANPADIDLEPVTLGGGSGYSFHQHYVCGEHVCTHAGHDAVTITWKKWTSTNSLPATAGYWYLDNDVKLDADYAPADGVELCLNGHAIDINGQTFTVASGVDLCYYECRGTASVTNGTFTVADSGSVVFARGDFAAVSGGTVVVPNEMTNVVAHGAFAPMTLLLGTNGVVKMASDFTLPSQVTVELTDDLNLRGNIKIFEPAPGVTTLDLEALAAKLEVYDPAGQGNEVVVYNGAIYATACYRVTFDAMDGQWADGDTEKTIIHYVYTGYELPAADPTRKNYEFAGWYVSWTNGARKIAADEALEVYANHRIYAKWLSKSVDPAQGETLFRGKDVDGGKATIIQGPTKDGSGTVTGLVADGNLAIPERIGNTTDAGKFVKTIGLKAYAYDRYDALVPSDKKIRSVSFPTYLTTIGDNAFAGCSVLTNIDFTVTRDYVTNKKATLVVGSRAFEGTAVERIVIPAGTTVKLGQFAFLSCPNLKEIDIFGTVLCTEKGPFALSGNGGEILLRLSPEYAADTNFVARLTADMNTSSVKISTEPLGKVDILSGPTAAGAGEIAFTFKADLTSPWGKVNENSVTLFYTTELTDAKFVGTGKFVYPTSVTGPDASGVYTAVFPDPSAGATAQYYCLTVGSER